MSIISETQSSAATGEPAVRLAFWILHQSVSLQKMESLAASTTTLVLPSYAPCCKIFTSAALPLKLKRPTEESCWTQKMLSRELAVCKAIGKASSPKLRNSTAPLPSRLARRMLPVPVSDQNKLQLGSWTAMPQGLLMP